MSTIPPEQLLFEVEEVLRAMPDPQSLGNDSIEVLSWLGRAGAALEAWDQVKGAMFAITLQGLSSRLERDFNPAKRKVLVLLHQARSDLRLRTVGPLAVAVPKGAVFEYFDEVRRVVQEAKSDILFCDPYLDAEFVSRYLPHVTPNVRVRLLGRERMPSLVSAASLFSAQHRLHIEVRSASGFHDRYLFTDGRCGYHSGASFKDGGRIAPTSFIQVTDAFAPLCSTYEELWANAKSYP